MAYQQPMGDVKKTILGSVDIEVSEDGVSYVTLGTGNGAKVEESFDVVELKSDNGGVWGRLATNQKCTVSFQMQEIDLEVLNLLRGGIDTFSVVAATPVAVAGEAHGTGLTAGVPFKLANKNGANTVVSSVVVKEDGVALTVNTDYKVIVGDGNVGIKGYTYIVPLAAQTGVITVDYTYIPNAKRVLSTGGKVMIAPRYVRATHFNEAGEMYRVTIYAARNTNGISMEFPADESGEILMLPIALTADLNTSRSKGDQLYSIEDERSY